MTPEEVLEIEFYHKDTQKELTVAGFLKLLLTTLWEKEQGFDSKRPWGNGGWQYDIYAVLIKAGVIPGKLDEDGFVDEIDSDEADRYIIDKLFEKLFTV